MSAWLQSLEGTSAGHDLALALALLAAILHALFGALQKGRHDPWLSRAAIDASYGIIAVPFALFVVPWPEPHMWPIFAGAFVIHAGYKLLQAMTYTRGAYTVVYPVVRGTGPLFAVIGAGIVFGEHFNPGQWAWCRHAGCGDLRACRLQPAAYHGEPRHVGARPRARGGDRRFRGCSTPPMTPTASAPPPILSPFWPGSF